MRKTDAEFGKMIRQATKGLRAKRRRLYDSGRRDSDYLESDADFFENNRFLLVAFLEALTESSKSKATTESAAVSGPGR